MDTVYTIDEIRGMLVPILARYNASGAVLFGSYARGEATPDSDLDVLVQGGDSFHPTDIFAIAEDLHQASGKRVDVYEASELDSASDFYRSVKRDELVLV
ncbi:nucleotidyltransferase family protein [Curtanaerobium respiraculi]|uniref:nucleotidyltransferase family protein n=1 Tax=Curtanaerobium respiraculi TaxID=2949669 RepID=UPI0024B3C512|nr:nucleotidyltransferase domain-containing protein [Curtanaerobium respiraculi]